tara:strand:- start:24331 stop:25689 length:1359 start_codon:yes stop_codon:yes gene_type:complete
MSNFVTQIQTNIKSPDGGDYTVNIGKHTLLIGNNESGKSAIAEALQLARTGSAYGLLYRDKPIKDGKLLSALIPPSQNEAVAVARFDNGSIRRWVLERGKRPKSSGANEGQSALSIAELHAVMSGSTETKVKFFWEVLCKDITAADLMDLLPKELHETLVLVCPLDRPVSLTDLLTKIGSLQRDQSAQVKASKIALESMGTVRFVGDDELGGVWNTLQRAMLRDLLKVIYLDYKADPMLQAGHVLSHLTKQLGGKDAIQRIPPTEDLLGEIGETLLHRRMTKVASLAKNGEVRASDLSSSLKALKNAVIQVMHDMLDEVADKFCKSVGKFLPKGDTLLFDASGGAINIGLTRDGEEHTALSGSTEARLLAAIAAGIAFSGDLIVVDDRMWDPLTLGKTLEVLEKSPCQVVVMSTIKPRGRKRSSWSYVEIKRTPGHPLEINDGTERGDSEVG